jgi:hypothetical protein
MIIGISLKSNTSYKLNQLCRSVKDGIFIKSQSSKDIDVAFDSITNILTENQLGFT